MRTSSRLGVLSSFSRLLVGLTLAISVLGGCRELDDGFPSPRDAGLDAQADAAIRDGAGLADLSWRTDLGWPAPMPPPASCNQRYPDVTGIQVVLRVDQYKGVRDGRNGPHEIVHGTIINTPWVYKAAIVDTTNVEVAMNIQTATDLTGLPMEIPVKPRDLIEVEGEYIPKSKASASTALGPAAVIHFTHHHCGYVVIEGVKYK
ncbi:MAG: hypothetical protein JNM83_02430 [Myxococcales bacterium]|nr:hypothetical protein [Myxococcales bacterium]